MALRDEVKQLLKGYKDRINDKNFKLIYDEAEELEADPELVGLLTQALLQGGINPIELDEKLNYIPQNYLSDSTEIISIIIPNKIKSIEENAFYMSSLQEVNFEANGKLTHIRPGAFSDCYFLKAIKLPSGVEVLGDNCFYNCEDLTYIYLPKTLYSIGEKCFYGTYMEEIEYEGTMKNFENILEKFFDEDARGEIQYIKCVDGVYELKD